MMRLLILCAGAACLLTANARAGSRAEVREAEQDAANAVRHGDYSTAVKFYEDCLTQTPDDLRLLINLGSAYFQNGQSEVALKTLERAMHIAPKEAAVYRVMGIVLYWQKADPDAMRCLERAVELDPQDVLAHKYLGLEYARLGDKRRAASESKLARNLPPAKRP